MPKGRIELYNGRTAAPMELLPEDWQTDIVAHSLAQNNRFTGHVHWPYSVAQHTRLVMRMLAEAGYTYRESFMGLLHDAGESFYGDVASPIKHDAGMKAFNQNDHKTEMMIYRMHGYADDELSFLPLVKDYDYYALTTEHTYLQPPNSIWDDLIEEYPPKHQYAGWFKKENSDWEYQKQEWLEDYAFYGKLAGVKIL